MSETRYQGRRLIVRRARLTDTDRATPWPDWRHFAFLTDLDGEATELNAFHRCHAVVELTIRDLKEGAGLEHLPSGRCEANGAWLACAVLAHNLVRRTATIGQPDPVEALTGARSLRYPARPVAGRLVNRAGTPTLRGPPKWPWRDGTSDVLDALRLWPVPSD